MGNHVSRRTTAGKVILSDGTIRGLLDQPTSVAELMLDHPQEFVVELNRRATAKPTPLPADHELDPAKVYLMIPMRQAKKAATVAAKAMAEEEARAVLAKGWNQPLMMMRCTKINTIDQQIVITHNSGVLVGGLVEEEEKPEFLSRQFSSKRWRPNLDPIEEKVVQRRFSIGCSD